MGYYELDLEGMDPNFVKNLNSLAHRFNENFFSSNPKKVEKSISNINEMVNYYLKFMAIDSRYASSAVVKKQKLLEVIKYISTEIGKIVENHYRVRFSNEVLSIKNVDLKDRKFLNKLKKEIDKLGPSKRELFESLNAQDKFVQNLVNSKETMIEKYNEILPEHKPLFDSILNNLNVTLKNLNSGEFEGICQSTFQNFIGNFYQSSDTSVNNYFARIFNSKVDEISKLDLRSKRFVKEIESLKSLNEQSHRLLKIQIALITKRTQEEIHSGNDNSFYVKMLNDLNLILNKFETERLDEIYNSYYNGIGDKLHNLLYGKLNEFYSFIVNPDFTQSDLKDKFQEYVNLEDLFVFVFNNFKPNENIDTYEVNSLLLELRGGMEVIIEKQILEWKDRVFDYKKRLVERTYYLIDEEDITKDEIFSEFLSFKKNLFSLKRDVYQRVEVLEVLNKSKKFKFIENQNELYEELDFYFEDGEIRFIWKIVSKYPELINNVLNSRDKAFDKVLKLEKYLEQLNILDKEYSISKDEHYGKHFRKLIVNISGIIKSKSTSNVRKQMEIHQEGLRNEKINLDIANLNHDRELHLNEIERAFEKAVKSQHRKYGRPVLEAKFEEEKVRINNEFDEKISKIRNSEIIYERSTQEDLEKIFENALNEFERIKAEVKALRIEKKLELRQGVSERVSQGTLRFGRLITVLRKKGVKVTQKE